MGILLGVLVGFGLSAVVSRSLAMRAAPILGFVVGLLGSAVALMVLFQISYPLGMSTTAIRSRAMEAYVLWGAGASLLASGLGAWIGRFTRTST